MTTTEEIDIVCKYKTVPELMEARSKDRPDKTYLIFQDKKWTYKEFQDETNRMASAFAKLGVKKGDHVAILIPNSPEFLFCYFGAMKAGAAAVTINTLLKADELDWILNDSDSQVLCTTPHYRKLLDPVWENLTKVKNLLLTEASENYPDGKDMEALRKEGDASFSIEVNENDIAGMLYTSGTTGHPKGVLLSHANFIYNSLVAPRFIDLQEDDVSLCIMPLFHVNAQVASMMATLQSGATVVLEEMFKPRSFIRMLKEYKCTTFSGVPTIYNYLNEMKEAEGEDLSFLKVCVCGAAPMPVEVFQTFEKKFGAKIIEGYGLSEGTCVSSLNPLLGERKIGSIGIPITGQEMAIWDTDGEPLPDGETGEIVIKGPNVMQGYYNNDEATADSVKDGWLRTGDLGYRDQDGYYFIVGRKKEMIIRGGENIYPKEIEEVLYEFDGIQDCAVVGIPDKKYGEEVAAFIQLKHGASTTSKEIKNYLRQRIADYKRPRVIELVTELPRTATGKIQKVKIVDEYKGNLKLINRVNGEVNMKYNWVYGSVLARFYNGLKNEGKFYGIKCPKCQKVQCPPKSYCAVCFEECTEWVELPNVGIVESWTTVHMEFPGQPMAPPYTYGYIKIEGSNTQVYHLIDKIDPDDIKMGMRVEPVWDDQVNRRGNLHDIKYFKPVE